MVAKINSRTVMASTESKATSNPPMASSTPGGDGAGCACGPHPTGTAALAPILRELQQFNLDLAELLRVYR